MYFHVLPFYSICLLTYFHIKIFAFIHEAENVLHALLQTVFYGQPQYAHGFSNFNLILCLQYA